MSAILYFCIHTHSFSPVGKLTKKHTPNYYLIKKKKVWLLFTSFVVIPDHSHIGPYLYLLLQY